MLRVRIMRFGKQQFSEDLQQRDTLSRCHLSGTLVDSHGRNPRESRMIKMKMVVCANDLAILIYGRNISIVITEILKAI